MATSRHDAADVTERMTADVTGRMTSPFLHDWLFSHAERTPDAPAVATPAVRLTYRALADRVRILAGYLAAGGIGRGDRVMLALPNSPAAIVAGLAVNSIGATSVEVSHAWSPGVLGEIVAMARVRQVFVSSRDARAWGGALAGWPIDRLWLVHPGAVHSGAVHPGAESGAVSGALRDALRVSRGDLPVSLMLEDGRVDPGPGAVPAPPASSPRVPTARVPSLPAPSPPALSPQLLPDEPALVLYTSGSTGKPHGVIQTFRNIDANTRSIVEYLGLTPDDRALLTLPLHYCYGRSVLQTHLFVGASLFLDNRFAFPRVVLDAMASEACTGFAGVPLTFEIFRRQVDVSSIEFPRLRYVTQAGGAMARDTIAWVRKAFHPAKLFVMYGQTEATARLAYLPPERAAEKAGSVGIAIPGVELRVVDEQGTELSPGVVGELVARGDNVTPGYLDEPEETASILRGGWLWTGDLAHRDADGFISIDGRARDILKIGGRRVSPVEIEQAIARHPDVQEAAVVGVRSELKGEVPVAFVVIRRGIAGDDAELRRHCRAELPAYKVPVRFIFVDSLPRNEAGKLLREQLAARAAAR
jgi:long-chain acyl-CoA synthetase